MSFLVKRHKWSINRNSNTETIDDSPSELTESSTKPVRHLFLVRHGQYQRQQTQSDGHLTPIGQKQALYAANFLQSQLPYNVLFDSLTHSDSKNKSELSNKN
jgi:hypothetical protein